MGDDAIRRRGNAQFRLHRLEDRDDLTTRDTVADIDQHLHHAPRDRCRQPAFRRGFPAEEAGMAVGAIYRD